MPLLIAGITYVADSGVRVSRSHQPPLVPGVRRSIWLASRRRDQGESQADRGGFGYCIVNGHVVRSTFKKGGMMSRRVLVTYATRAGSTAEVAAAIGESIAARGDSVDVKSVDQVPNVEGYEVVVIGSAVRMGKWLPEAVRFVERNQAALAKVPVALFTIHMLNTGDDDASRTAREGYLAVVRPLLGGAEEVFFAGAMDLSRLSFLDRSIARMVGATDEDRRDWGAIRGWSPSALG